METSKPVVENGVYDTIWLLCEKRLGLRGIVLRVNGGDDIQTFVQDDGEEQIDSQSYFKYRVAVSFDDARMFQMVYGLARIEVSASVEGLGRVAFTTKDIPCLSTDVGKTAAVDDMLHQILEPASMQPLTWMLTNALDQSSRFSTVEGGFRKSASKSIGSFLQLVKTILACYEKNSAFFMTQSFSRVQKRSETVSYRSVRHVGSRELLYVSQNLDRATPSGDVGFEYAGHCYCLDKLKTDKPYRSYNNYENQIVLGFLARVQRTLISVKAKLQASVSQIDEMGQALRAVVPGDMHFMPLIIVETCLKNDKHLLEHVDQMLTRSRKLHRKLLQGMPGVRPSFRGRPHRTKVFEELAPYSEVFRLVLKWLEFGDFSLAGESLAFHTYRMDKLYEIYVLYRLLAWLSTNGFVPDLRSGEAFSSPIYTLKSRYFLNETAVRTRYKLRRDDEFVEIYYQPVIYGDEREEAGITLHRTTTPKYFMENADSYWTPDYLIKTQTGTELQRTFILDAKFAKPERICQRGDAPDFGLTLFDKCYQKYFGETLDSVDGRPVDGVWLLCGRSEKAGLRYFQNSGWMRSIERRGASGVVPLSPAMDAIEDLFGVMGVAAIHDEPQNATATSFASTDETTSSPISVAVQEVESKEFSAPLATHLTADEPPARLRPAPVETAADDSPSQLVEKRFPEVAAEQEQAAIFSDHPSAKYKDSSGPAQKNVNPKRSKGRTHSPIQEEGIKLALQWRDSLARPEDAFDARAASRLFGVSHPIFRNALPKSSGERKLYRDVSDNEGKLYVFAGWKPNTLNRLKRNTK